MANTLTYYDLAIIISVKSFVAQDQRLLWEGEAAAFKSKKAIRFYKGSPKGLHSGRLQPCPQMLDYGGSECNSLAYYDTATISAVKSLRVQLRRIRDPIS
jgi:hypothetical protein